MSAATTARALWTTAGRVPVPGPALRPPAAPSTGPRFCLPASRPGFRATTARPPRRHLSGPSGDAAVLAGAGGPEEAAPSGGGGGGQHRASASATPAADSSPPSTLGTGALVPDFSMGAWPVAQEERGSRLPKPPAGPRPRVWPYNRSERLPLPPPDAVQGVPREEFADWDLARHDKVLNQFVNNYFRHGRKGQYVEYVKRAFFLIHQRTGENPLRIFREAVDSVTPVMRIGREVIASRVLEYPYPIAPAQGRRMAFVWIMQAADRRKELHIYERLAGELISVWKGLSGVNKEKARLHKQCLQNRGNAKIRFL